MTFIATIQQSAIILLTKINGLSFTYLAPKSSLPPFHHGCRHLYGLECFFSNPPSNILFRPLAPRQLQTSNFLLTIPLYGSQYYQC